MPAARRRATGESACTSAARRRHLPGQHSRCPEPGHDPDRATAAQHPGTGGRAVRRRAAGARGRRRRGSPRPVGGRAPADAAVLDLGCGPGRHSAHLARRGRRVVGIDTSPAAVLLTRTRGVHAVRADALGPLPDGPQHGPAGWHAVLLLDGNIGIGGDPLLLLRRARDLLRQDGRVLVELDRGGSPSGAQSTSTTGSGRAPPSPGAGWAAPTSPPPPASPASTCSRRGPTPGGSSRCSESRDDGDDRTGSEPDGLLELSDAEHHGRQASEVRNRATRTSGVL